MEKETMEKKTLYLECYSGISGDMTVAALIDLGADTNVLLEGLGSLNVDGYKIKISRKQKNSIEACDFHVILDHDNHDHDLDYLFSHEQDKEHKDVHTHSELHNDSYVHNHYHIHNESKTHNHSHTLGEHNHIHNLNHVHQHSHAHNHLNVHGDSHVHNYEEILSTPLHYGKHEHRNLNDINTIIDASSISDRAKEIAKKIFYIIAVAEAKAHGKSVDEVHFHEVGAIDSIVDIVAVAICLDNLNIQDVIVSELYEGTGQITCQHGVLPIPVPAVVNIASTYALPLHITNVKGELVTPTGAAIVAAIKTKDRLPQEFTIKKIGLGLGKRNYERTSFLRAMIIEEKSKANHANQDSIWVLEANIDDCSGEALSLVLELLLQEGAKDVYYTPIYMKKNRPAYMLSVICKEEQIRFLEEIIFKNTTTIGIRRHLCERTILEREIKTIKTPLGDAIVKLCRFQDKVYCYPEYESIKTLMKKKNLDYQTVYRIIQNAFYAD